MNISPELRERIIDILERYEFASLEWNGEDITLYTASGTPWSKREFTEFSPTKLELEALDDDLAEQFDGITFRVEKPKT